MSEDRIKLPDFLIADLYKHSLVELEGYATELVSEHEDAPELVSDVYAAKLRYLGENDKKVIIVVDEKKTMHLNEQDLSFLTNVLKACQLYLTDIAIINIDNQKVTFSEIKEQLHAVSIILFNVDPDAIRLPFKIPAFQRQKYAGCTVMLAPSLSVLNLPSNESRLLKTKLWHSLKELFDLS